MATWRVKLLGEFALMGEDGLEVALPGRKHQALIAFVLLSAGRSVPRSRVPGLLWRLRSEAQARASLRGVLSEIRRALKRHGTPFLEADRTHIFIRPDSVEVDLDAFVESVDVDSAEVVSNALSLFRGDVLESLQVSEQGFEEWKAQEQRSARSVYQRLLARHLGYKEQEGDTPNIEKAANRLLDLDDTDEVAHRALMRLYARLGQSSQAMQQYELCQRRLRERYGADASEETRALRSMLGASFAERARDSDAPAPSGQSVRSGRAEDDREIYLAVLPFNVHGARNDDREYGELLGEEIIGAAAKFKWFRVAPSSETFNAGIRSLGSLAVSKATGAKYVLHGRVRRLNGGYALSVELVDGFNRQTVWSERFTLPSESLSYPDDMVARVVGRLDVRMRASEISQAHRLKGKSLTAYQCALLALSNMYDMSLATYLDSERLFAEAVKHDPDHSWFYSVWAFWKMFCLGQDWAPDRAGEFSRAAELARQAIKRDPDDALALVIAGHFESLWVRNLHQGKKLVDTSLELNPYSSFAWMLSSATYTYCGRPVEALERLEHSRMLCPVETHFEYLFDTAYCIAHLSNRDPSQAAEWGLKTVRENPKFTHGHKHLLSALGHLGREEECRAYTERLMTLEPGFRLDAFVDSYPFARDEDRAYYREGLARAMGLLGSRKRSKQ